MAWVEIKLRATASKAEEINHFLTESGALAITTEDAGDQPLYEPLPGATPIWDEIIVTALYEESAPIDDILSRLIQQFEDTRPLINHLEDQDWERTWMQDFQPMQFGERLWIIPSYQQLDASPCQVVLDPGLAFGTGKHPTTALCLKWLDSNIQGGEVIIDYGCGSGILGIAALRLGASKVIAIDYDPQAILATQENAKQNKVSEHITAVLPEETPQITADILIANILANPLVELAETFSTLVRPCGKIILSGILEHQVQDVTQAYQQWFDINLIAQQEEWMRIDAIRKSQ